MSSREERVARNEAISREINEEMKSSHAEEERGGYVRVVCECGHDDCDRVVAITVEEYESLRSDPRRFAVGRDHVVPDVEATVEENDRFLVVEKVDDEAAEIAEETDPGTQDDAGAGSGPSSSSNQ